MIISAWTTVFSAAWRAAVTTKSDSERPSLSAARFNRLLGGLTTTPLPVPEEIDHMKNRIEKQYPGEEPYGELDTRRPDVVIVKDPTRPPTAENISHVTDFKLNDDPWRGGQRKSYEKINTSCASRHDSGSFPAFVEDPFRAVGADLLVEFLVDAVDRGLFGLEDIAHTGRVDAAASLQVLP